MHICLNDFHSNHFFIHILRCTNDKLKYSIQDRQKPFSEFQQIAAVDTCDKFRYKSFLKPYRVALFIFNTIYDHWICFQTRGSLFFLSCSHHQKHPEEALPEVRFNRKQTSMTRVPYNKLLTNLASSSRIGIIGPRSFCMNLAALGPYCHDLGPIFPGTALALG